MRTLINVAFVLAIAMATMATLCSPASPSPEELVIRPGRTLIKVGETTQWTAESRAGRTREDVTTRSQWSSSDPSVAQVSQTGLVTGVTPGDAVIIVSFEGQTGLAGIVVQP